VGAALITSSLAVSVSSFVTHDQPNLHWPNPDVTYLLIAYAVALAPLALVTGLVFNRLMGWAGQRELPKSWLLIPGIAGAGLLVGVCSHWWPELPGNGRSILNIILAGGMTLSTAAIVLVLKLVVTATFLRVGARGGLFTPALATGAAAGTLFVLTINAVAGTQFHVPAIALAGSAAVLAITQNAPLWAAIFVWELARPPLWLLLVFLTAATSTYGLRLLVKRSR
jgi:H+/Cl- antiporter ClcA